MGLKVCTSRVVLHLLQRPVFMLIFGLVSFETRKSYVKVGSWLQIFREFSTWSLGGNQILNFPVLVGEFCF